MTPSRIARPVFFIFALLALAGTWSCSKKQAESEIALGTPTPATSQTPLPAATPNATTALSFAMPSPTVTPESLQYEVEDIQGTVLALLDGGSDPQTVVEGATLQKGDSLITRAGSEATLSLNDVTAVHVSESTTVRIADLTPNDSQGFISRLELAGGKVLSEVEKLDQSRSTFEVSSDGVVCGVRGTAFEVENQDGQVSTNTFHGAVEVSQGEHRLMVRDGEHSAFSFSRRAFLAKRRLTAVETRRYSAWSKVYKRARQKRAQRLEWLRTRPQTPEAQRFLQRRENWRQRRVQLSQHNLGAPARLAPRPLEKRPGLKRFEPRKHSMAPRGLHPLRSAQNHQAFPSPGMKTGGPARERLRPQALPHPAQGHPALKPGGIKRPQALAGKKPVPKPMTPKKTPPRNFQKKKLKP